MSQLPGSVAIRRPVGLPATDLGRPARPRVRRPLLAGELIVILLLLRAYDLIRGHAQLRQAAALQHGWQLLDAERWLHLDPELDVNRWTTAHAALALAASYWYQFFHIS
ncbi:MAG TPA: hypothetical protein VFD94_05040, partial [Jatrophihabitans sp.]|nr:hypothetical protein [Jatrophihabitans sp.]